MKNNTSQRQPTFAEVAEAVTYVENAPRERIECELRNNGVDIVAEIMRFRRFVRGRRSIVRRYVVPVLAVAAAVALVISALLIARRLTYSSNWGLQAAQPTSDVHRVSNSSLTSTDTPVARPSRASARAGGTQQTPRRRELNTELPSARHEAATLSTFNGTTLHLAAHGATDPRDRTVFWEAASKTASPHGEISVMDPGGYGAVSIYSAHELTVTPDTSGIASARRFYLRSLNELPFNPTDTDPTLSYLMTALMSLRSVGNLFGAGSDGDDLPTASLVPFASCSSGGRDVTELDGMRALAALRTLRPVTYQHSSTNSANALYLGFVGQDVPQLVSDEDHLGLRAPEIVVVLTKVVQEQQQSIEELKRRIAQLESAAGKHRQ